MKSEEQKKKHRDYMREYTQRPGAREKNLKRKKEYYQNHKNEKKEYDKKRRIEKRELLSKQMKEYYEKNKKEIREYKRVWTKEKSKTDSLFKFKRNIRSLIKESIKRTGTKKSKKTVEILGCSIEEFKQYLENKFENWMNWGNYGKCNGTLMFGWDIDHIVPLVSAKTEKEVIKLNHYTNFQPLDSYINRNIKRGISPLTI